MKAYAITWNDEPSPYEIYTNRQAAEQRLQAILETRTYDRIPDITEIEIQEQYTPYQKKQYDNTKQTKQQRKDTP